MTVTTLPEINPDARTDAAMADAAALICAVADRDGETVRQILADCDLPAVALVLAELVPDDTPLPIPAPTMPRRETLSSAYARTVASVVRAVAYGLHIAAEDLYSPSKTRAVADARHVVFYVAHQAGVPYNQIGKLTGRDHTTVMHGVRRVAGDTRLLTFARVVQGLPAAELSA